MDGIFNKFSVSNSTTDFKYHKKQHVVTCNITEILLLKSCKPIRCISSPLNFIVPCVSDILNKAWIIELLPEPVRPTMPTCKEESLCYHIVWSFIHAYIHVLESLVLAYLFAWGNNKISIFQNCWSFIPIAEWYTIKQYTANGRLVSVWSIHQITLLWKLCVLQCTFHFSHLKQMLQEDKTVSTCTYTLS